MGHSQVLLSINIWHDDNFRLNQRRYQFEEFSFDNDFILIKFLIAFIYIILFLKFDFLFKSVLKLAQKKKYKISSFFKESNMHVSIQNFSFLEQLIISPNIFIWKIVDAIETLNLLRAEIVQVLDGLFLINEILNINDPDNRFLVLCSNPLNYKSKINLSN